MGLWFKQVEQGRRFLVKIGPDESLQQRLTEFARVAEVNHGIVLSAVGSVHAVRFRGIKAGAKLPLTAPRIRDHEVDGPLELLGLTGNIFPDERGEIDCHLHIIASKSSGEVLGGQLYDAKVFATCEIMVTEVLTIGVERHLSKTGGVRTVFIGDEEP